MSSKTANPSPKSTSTQVKTVRSKKASAPEVVEPTSSETPVTSAKSSRSKKVPVATTPVVETAVVTDDSVVVPAPVEEKKLATSEDVVNLVNVVIAKLKVELSNAKARKDKEAVVSLNESVKQLGSIKKPIDKLARSKPPRKQISIDANKNGFLKPVKISKDLAAFLGCDENEMKSRVQVTQAICKYIQDKNLQNPKNRREILVDPVLQNLLKFDPATENTNLAYYQIQSRIQPHFIKDVVVA